MAVPGGSNKSNVRSLELFRKSKLMQHAVLFGSLLVLTFFGSSQGQAVVTTDCGGVLGTTDISSNGTSVWSFRGIPYAVPPVGSLRWTRPVSLSQAGQCWTGTLNGTNFGSPCLQYVSYNGGPLLYGDEDCLFLNVWTPKLPSSEGQELLPVMVWIHGGAFRIGSGDVPGYMPSADSVTAMNVVMVSLNYRLGAFGFLALNHPDGEFSSANFTGNYGFLDQVAALQWVQKNIANFGGDPTRVTVFGQSAGGVSVFVLSASPLAAGLFHQGIVMSPAVIFNGTLEGMSQYNALWLANTTQCDSVDCLLSFPAPQLLLGSPWPFYPDWVNGLPSPGVVENAFMVVTDDDYLLTEAPMAAWSSGNIPNPVPLVIGTTGQETEVLPPMEVSNLTWHEYNSYVRGVLSQFSKEIAEDALKFYGEHSSSGLTTTLSYFTMGSDVRVTCPVDVGAAAVAKGLSIMESSTGAIYRYVVDEWPSGVIYIFGSPCIYAGHGWDAISLFNGTAAWGLPPAPKDLAFGDKMRTWVGAFVWSGPEALDQLGWMEYPSHTTHFTQHKVEITGGYHEKECDFWLGNGFFEYGWMI